MNSRKEERKERLAGRGRDCLGQDVRDEREGDDESGGKRERERGSKVNRRAALGVATQTLRNLSEASDDLKSKHKQGHPATPQ